MEPIDRPEGMVAKMLSKVLFVAKLGAGLFLATSAWPGIQMFWVMMLTGIEGLTANNMAYGEQTPFYGWYLIVTRLLGL